MIVTVAITAIVVSLDSFMAGFSLSLNKRQTPTLPSAVALVTLLLCIATSCLGSLLSRLSEMFVNYLGAALLTLLAAAALFRKDSAQSDNLKSVGIGESLTIGVAVGMDAAIANFSFAGEGVELITPIVFAVTHYFTVALGQIIAKKVNLSRTNLFSAAILLTLAVTKLF